MVAERSSIIAEYPRPDDRQSTDELPLNNASIAVIGAAHGCLGVWLELELELGLSTAPAATPSLARGRAAAVQLTATFLKALIQTGSDEATCGVLSSP